MIGTPCGFANYCIWHMVFWNHGPQYWLKKSRQENCKHMCIYIMYIPLYIYIYICIYIYVCMYTPPKMLGFIEYIHTKCSRDHYHYVTVLIFPVFPIGWYLHRSLMSRVPMLPSHKTERCIFVGVVLPGAALGTLKGSRTNVKTGNMIPWWRAIMLHGVYIYIHISLHPDATLNTAQLFPLSQNNMVIRNDQWKPMPSNTWCIYI